MDLQPDLWIHRQEFESYPTTKLFSWCHFRLRPQLEERNPWDELVSEGRLSSGSRRLSQGPKCVIGELSIKPGHAYRNLQVYKTHHVTGHTSIGVWPECQLAQEEQCSMHPLRCLQQFPGNASTPWSIQPCQWAIWLHLHYIEREQFPRCNSSFSSSSIARLRPAQCFRQCPTMDDIVIQHPTMYVIVWLTGTPWGRSFRISSVKCEVIVWSDYFFSDDWPCEDLDQGFLYRWICIGSQWIPIWCSVCEIN